MNPRSPAKFSTTVMPAVRPGTWRDGERSTPTRAQYSATTREPRSSDRRVDRPARTPDRPAALATVTAPPQEIANSSVKISSPGPGSDATWPKTISRNTRPKAIRSMWPPSPEGHSFGVGPGDVAGGAVPGEQFPQWRRDVVAFVDGQRAPPAEPAAGCGVDHLGRLAPVGLGPHVQGGERVGNRRQQ